MLKLEHMRAGASCRDDRWRSLREAWAPFFYSGSLEQFAERMNYSAKLLCLRLDAVADSPSGQTINMYDCLADLTMVRPGQHQQHSCPAACRA